MNIVVTVAHSHKKRLEFSMYQNLVEWETVQDDDFYVCRLIFRAPGESEYMRLLRFAYIVGVAGIVAIWRMNAIEFETKLPNNDNQKNEQEE